MTFLSPWFLVVAAAAAAGVVLLHFIVTAEPRTLLLPTARFAPDRPVRARARAVRLQDLLLLTVRVLLVIALGAALARPVLLPRRRPLGRIVIADRSAAVRQPREVSDSVAALRPAADAVMPLDSAGLSAALIAALREASRARRAFDSLDLTIVSPLVESELDAATDSIRALWPGPIRVIRVAAAQPAPRTATVIWPDCASRASCAPLAPRSRPDTVGAVVAGDNVVVAPFVRAFTLPRSHSPTLPLVVARWVDGEPAAVEESTAAGCTRTIAVRLPSRGDLVLSAAFARFRAALSGPCGGRDLVPIDAARLAGLAGAARPRVAAGMLAASQSMPAPAAVWLLVAALLLSAGELLLRSPRAPTG